MSCMATTITRVGPSKRSRPICGRTFLEVERADQAIPQISDLESFGVGHGRPLGATLVKMVDEYALHAGQVHMLRFAALGKVIR